MKEIVDELRFHLFQQDKQKTIEKILECIETMSKNLSTLSQDNFSEYSFYMKQVEMFFGRGDYLAVSDVIKYDILPLFEGEGEELC